MLAPVVLSMVFAAATEEPEILPPDYADVEPRRFRYRASSLLAGVRGTFTFYDSPTCGDIASCPPGPVLGFSSEFGTRSARLLLETYTAPVPYFPGDIVVIEALNFGFGGLFGNERFRGGATLVTGAFTLLGVDGRFLAAPWTGRRGGRHGIEIRVGTTWWLPLHVGIHYRWFPAALNRRRSSPANVVARPAKGRYPGRDALPASGA
jgi:hypothetical protein